ncbi:hypothetical protein B0181_11850 [Moraxella caviae]|uniref:Transcriptional regulator n=1 Tax=Moraxella caviae TaxID=34060 RepID=A0A1S9ZQP4_9GAMM|nr:hypothetical protein [Moraxella caviae]OOR85879.1 hypothetical protein B0181_11850 [Moraxella caviae]STZ14020.1 Uncharacterised protein [Moraxella caviae]VEW12844.1 Uncharacterised protein [Moraxella caviae]
MSKNIISEVINHFGGRKKVADIFGLTYVSVAKWEKKGRLPYTDYIGETQYAATLARLSNGAFTQEQLLQKTPSAN